MVHDDKIMDRTSKK